MPDYILQTERMLLREFTLDDTKFIIELLNSPGWLQNIGDRNVHTEEQAASYLQNGPLNSYRQNGYGLSMVVLKEENIPIGMSGIIKRDYLDDPDIGFALLPQYFGQGYAFEIAKAILDYAKEHLNIYKVSAIVLPQNHDSIKLIKKLGLQQLKTIRLPGSDEELFLYRN